MELTLYANNVIFVLPVPQRLILVHLARVLITFLEPLACSRVSVEPVFMLIPVIHWTKGVYPVILLVRYVQDPTTINARPVRRPLSRTRITSFNQTALLVYRNARRGILRARMFV